MTKDEARTAMAAESVKAGKDYRGEKVLAPVYSQVSYIGVPLFAFGDGSEDGWEVGDAKKCFAYYHEVIRGGSNEQDDEGAEES